MERLVRGPVGALALVAATLGLLIGPSDVAAQSEVDPADAEFFLGSWTLPLQTAQGAFTLLIDIEEVDGSVTAEVGSDMMGSETVDQVSLQEESMRLQYSMNAQGQVVPVELMLTPDGEDLDVDLDFAGGQFAMSGTATKTSSP